MSATVEVVSGLQRRIKVAVPAEEMEKDYNKRLNEYKKGIKIKGFRPGKVPVDLIKKRHGKAIQQEVRDEAVRQALVSAIEDNNLTVVGAPDFKMPEWQLGDSLSFEAECEVYPEINLDGISDLKATRYEVQVTDEDVNKMLESLASQHTEWTAVEREAADGDSLVIDFVGSMNGEVFEGGSANDFRLQLGSNQMIPGFESGLIGIKPGVSRELKLVFPEDYHAKELAGQSVEFAVTAKEVLAGSLPEINDELAAKLGFANGLEALKKVINEQLMKEATKALQSEQKEDVLDQLLAANVLELPARLVDAEVGYLQSAAKHQTMAEAGGEESAVPEDFPREDYLEQAERRVKLGLLLSGIVKHYELAVDQQAVRQRVEQMAMSYPNPREVVEWLYKDRSRLAEIETAVLEDQAIEKVLESLNQEPTVMTYQEAIDKVNAAREAQEKESNEEGA